MNCHTLWLTLLTDFGCRTEYNTRLLAKIPYTIVDLSFTLMLQSQQHSEGRQNVFAWTIRLPLRIVDGNNGANRRQRGGSIELHGAR